MARIQAIMISAMRPEVPMGNTGVAANPLENDNRPGMVQPVAMFHIPDHPPVWRQPLSKTANPDYFSNRRLLKQKYGE